MITIRPLIESDIDKLNALQPEEWGPIEPSFTFFLSQPFCFPFVAERDGHIIGTANGIQNKRSSWVSHIIVAKEHRCQGVGAQLTEFILDVLRKRGNTTILLLASELGQKLYPKFGFQTVGYYHFFKGSINDNITESPLIRSTMLKDARYIFALDKKMSGEDRSDMLKLHIQRGFVYESRLPHRICGYYLPTLGEGLIVAADNDAGIELFKKRLKTNPTRIVVPRDNVVVNEYLAALGFVHYASAPRMVLGKNVKWRPRMMFSRVGGWYG